MSHRFLLAKQLERSSFLRFCVVGGVGFLCDALVLELGVAAGLTPLIARLVSMAFALQVTYILHRFYTFSSTQPASKTEWLRFMASNSLGVVVNYSIFALGLYLIPIQEMETRRWVAFVSGTLLAMILNYLLNRHLVFKA
jgi:putative flippase GtrA